MDDCSVCAFSSPASYTRCYAAFGLDRLALPSKPVPGSQVEGASGPREHNATRAKVTGSLAWWLQFADRSYATMDRTSAITRRRVLELLGATSLPLAALPYGRAADDKMEKKRRILFFTKSSGFEHDPVKRNVARLPPFPK
jgi:hypothetical protein